VLKTHSAAREFLLHNPTYSVAADFDKWQILVVVPMMVDIPTRVAVDSIHSGNLVLAGKLSAVPPVAEQAS
jgi:hypothetical protein